ncbi:MAG: flagellar motor protein MotB [Planctomycetales bacterium]
MMDEEDAPAGVPEWIVTYGDMMSLLLTFFIMLVSLSEIVATEKYRAVLDALQRYIGYRTGPAAPPGKHFPLNSLVAKLGTLGSFTNADRGFGGVKTPAVEGRNLRVYRTPEGVPVPVLGPVPFAPGKSDLAPQAAARLPAIAAELAGKPNKIELRAHAGPMAGSGEAARRALLDSTYHRARAVMEGLVELGVERQRMRITSAGDSEPLPDTGDDRSRVLDRVEVYLLDALADDYVGPAAAMD